MGIGAACRSQPRTHVVTTASPQSAQTVNITTNTSTIQKTETPQPAYSAYPVQPPPPVYPEKAGGYPMRTLSIHLQEAALLQGLPTLLLLSILVLAWNNLVPTMQSVDCHSQKNYCM